MSAVSNSSPLIYLSALGDLNLLHRLLGAIVIPQAVYREVVLSGIVNGSAQPGAKEVQQVMGTWLTLVEVEDQSAVARLQHVTGMHEGECEAITLAGQLGIATVVLDDQHAVREAEIQGMTIVRTPALYLAAKRAGIIEQIKPKLDSLRSFGFRLRDDHYRAILQKAGEL